MYLVIIAWMYVVLMMSVAEATNTTGTLLGAIVTFFLYGVGPAGLLVYLMGTPARKRAIKKREADALAATRADVISNPPDASSHTPGGLEPVATIADISSVPPVRKEP
ncbi:MAG: hypothetical protein WBK51_07465 [Polaromonas sp.]